MAERNAMLLTPDEYRDFRRMRQAFLGGSRTDKTRGGGFDAGADAAQTPDLFVVRAPTGGIPALSLGSNTGSGTDYGDHGDDVPGQAVCRVFRVTRSGSTLAVRQVATKEITVVNLSTAAVTEGEWVVVARTKHGEFVVLNTIGLRFSEC